MKKKAARKNPARKQKDPVPKKPDKQWDTLKDSESLKEKAPPVKYPDI